MMDLVDLSVDTGAAPLQALPIRELDDSQLLSLLRDGHPEAIGELYVRYWAPGKRLALYLGMKSESGDVVAEAFTQILDLIGRGKGPERNFPAYLFATIRHESGRRAKERSRLVSTEAVPDSPVPFVDSMVDSFERLMLRLAFESLPLRWKSVLWSIEVEGKSLQDVGAATGMHANAVSALAYRARQGLRVAYLHQHVDHRRQPAELGCAMTLDCLAATIRGKAPRKVSEAVAAHTATCGPCANVFAWVSEVNDELQAAARQEEPDATGVTAAKGMP